MRTAAGGEGLLQTTASLGVHEAREGNPDGCVYVFVKQGTDEAVLTAIRELASVTWANRKIVMAVRSPILSSDVMPAPRASQPGVAHPSGEKETG
jgi:hypothetical protein